jgi:histidine triad (HIT) family protein
MDKNDCIFCKIVTGEIPAKVVERGDGVIAIEDVNPQAPVHILVLPEKHVANIAAHTASGTSDDVARLMRAAAKIGEKHAGGFRLVVNTGADGGQTVDHLHVHVLAGRHLSWPPG